MYIVIRILLPIIFLLFFSGCTTKEYALFQDINQETSNDKKTLSSSIDLTANKISPRDRLHIEVYNGNKPIVSDGGTTQNYLDPIRGYMVSDDGSVYLPLVGSVHLGGLNQSQASRLLTKKYGEYLRFPYAKVDILNQRIYVLGEVKNPGVVAVTNEQLNIYEALAQVGDFTDYADRKDIKIVRYVKGQPVIESLDITHAGYMQVSNLMLKPNDIIYIPPRNLKVYLKEAGPILETVNRLLTPFVNIKYLRD